MGDRFFDKGRPIYELIGQPVDVRCPRCGERASLGPWGVDEAALHSPRRLACDSCGFTRDHDGQVLSFSADGVDPCFGYPLWFRVETSKGVIWAYHRDHLEELRSFVSADTRERAKNPTWSNRGYYSRLPRWIKSAKNRESVTKAIDLLIERSAGPPGR